jgi:uncharacterized protein (TIGR03435 family)
MPRIIMVALLLAATLTAQAPAFDVVSVKRNPGTQGMGRGITVQPGGRFMAPGATLLELAAAAYELLDQQILGGPDWLDTQRFEVLATTRPDVTIEEARAMLRRLLAERFRLAAHVETRELAVYALTMARDDRRLGNQLRRSGPECAIPTPPRGVPPPPPPPAPPAGSGRVLELDGGGLACPSLVFGNAASGHMSIRKWPMGRLARYLTGSLGRPVLDRTGLDGTYDLDLTYATESQVLSSAGTTDYPALTTAIREQLGLRLESSRAPVDVLVIDRAEPPADN